MLTVVVLAAGEGTRMRSTTPKVLHPLCGRTMLGHVLAATGALHPDRTLVVVGHGREAVIATLPSTATAVTQEVQGGTGHAVRTALDAADVTTGTVVVVPGDAPLLTAASLTALVSSHADAAATVLTTHVESPQGYGRILRTADGLGAIVEERDCTDVQRAITEVNTGVYAFDAARLREALTTLGTTNAAGEEYLTDVVQAFSDKGFRQQALVTDALPVVGVNDRVQLAEARRAINDRLVRAALLAGVTITDPATTWLDVSVTYEPDAVVHQNTQLHGSTHLGAHAVVGPNSTLTDTRVGPGARVESSTTTGSDIGPGASVGPYAHLRSGTVLGEGAKVGAYAETKNATLGDGAKVPHLAYVGDATVGARSNIGAGTIFANYDGVAKHRIEVGEDVKIGSNNTLVSPVRIGDRAYTGGDALIRSDVPAGSLAFSANEQVTKDGWVADNRPAPHNASPPDLAADPSRSDDIPEGTESP